MELIILLLFVKSFYKQFHRIFSLSYRHRASRFHVNIVHVKWITILIAADIAMCKRGNIEILPSNLNHVALIVKSKY